MLALLLFATAAPTAIDAERAFARDAQLNGQWPAFLAWSSDDAIMFLPQPSNAHIFLKDRKSPPVAVSWWPSEGWLSCDGKTAINRGPWIREGGKSTGWFTTVWQMKPQGWRWLLDHGDAVATPLPAGDRPTVHRASCHGPRDHGRIPFGPSITGAGQTGMAGDRTLRWDWTVAPNGERIFQAFLWTGKRWERVLYQHVAAEQ